MTIRVHSSVRMNDQLHRQINEKVGRLQRFFDRINAAEIYFREAPTPNEAPEEKEVGLRVYVLRRVLYVSAHSKCFEDALLNATEKMRKQLRAYEKEISLY